MSKNRLLVASIVVTYHPVESAITALLTMLSRQSDYIALVANSPVTQSLRTIVGDLPNIHLTENQENVGLAEAQNQGINVARGLGCGYLVFFDQDSSPTSTHIDRLLLAEESLLARGYRVGAIGPLLWDTHAGSYWPFHTIGWFQLSEVHGPSIDTSVPLPYVVSSGSLIRTSVIDVVGTFDRSLFIDNIDVEWGFRAASMKYQSFGCFDVVMQHTIGDRQVRLLGKTHPLHTQQRHYFLFRSSVRLMKLKHIPNKWKANELLRIIPRLFVYSAFSNKPVTHFCAGILGIVDGVLGREVPHWRRR